ncbi:MAG: hypothetical protein MJ198_03280 [Bacteroidales bacterium]|nr:hypothetical protein [Bacteroidales bacterium]
MKRFTVLLILWLSCFSVFAQRENQKWYNNGIGLRAEVVSTPMLEGIDYDHFFHYRFGMNMMFLTEFHSAYEGAILFKYVASYPNLTSRMRWYCGGGIVGGAEMRSKDLETAEDIYYAGPTACLGTGYSFKKAPINLGIEWRPSWKAYYKNYDKNSPNQDKLNIKTVALTVRFITWNKYKK